MKARDFERRRHVVKKRKRRPNLRNKIKGKIFFLLLFATCLFCILIGRLFYVQVMISDDLTRRALHEMTKTEFIRSDRGLILDRTGKKLAVNISCSDIYLDPSLYEKKPLKIEDLEKTLGILAENIGVSEKDLKKKIKDQKVTRIAKDLDRSKSLKIRDLNLPGVRVEDRSKRFYPFNNLASHVIGFTNQEGHGLYGVESYYNDELAGISGKMIGIKDTKNVSLPVKDEENYAPKEGLNVALSIDETIQKMVEDIAVEAKENAKAKKVSVIVQDCTTGEILAMTNKEDYNLNFPRNPQTTKQKEKWDDYTDEEKSNIWYANWRNFSVNDLYEPGSTFKSITAAAALEEDVTTPEEHFYCTGYIRDVPGGPLKCTSHPDPFGDITMAEGYAKSCNTTFVRIGRSLGREKLLKYIKGFGFGERTGIDLPGEENGIIPKEPKSIRELELATLSYGHGIAVTPIQLINAISSIANGGNLMKPRIIHEIVDNEGNPVKVFSPVIRRRVISKSTSDAMLDLMEGVVEEGTATRAKIPGYRFGGKTGTANMVSKDGGYEEDKFVSSFVGVAPLNSPKFTILVIVQEPEGDYYGGAVAAPAAAKAMEQILAYSGIPKTEKISGEGQKSIVEVPDVTNMLIEDAGKVLVEAGLKFNAEYTGQSDFTIVTRQTPSPGTEVDGGTIVDLYLDPNLSNSKTMPILTGKTKDEVIDILSPLDVEYEFEGEGVVIEQWPKPGKVISWKKPVKITLAKPLHESDKEKTTQENSKNQGEKNSRNNKNNEN
ncbi:MAG: penicillin-binding transpeptidase domain-containing protein [Tissierellia bacterium]|nr:penicillin-binding transpeptidase domain-containing protein [Tissierellia bacterium]